MRGIACESACPAGLRACALGLDTFDKATVGAKAGQHKHALDTGSLQIGLQVTAYTAIDAIATLPMGILVDCVQRVRRRPFGFYGAGS